MKPQHPMTKSPRAVAREALALAQQSLPAYTSARSRKDYTSHQLFAILALKAFRSSRLTTPGWSPSSTTSPKSGPTWGSRRCRTSRPCATRSGGSSKGEFVVLLYRATTSALDRGLIGGDPEVAVDATGMESRHTSRYFARRSGSELTSWTKLTTATHTTSHFLAGARVSTGPSNDSPQLRPVMAQACLVVTWDRMLADAAFDSEANHAYPRDELGVRSTVIPINHRGHDADPGGFYRGQMVARFRPKPEGSR
jgi:hypothetical protein